MSHWGGDSDNTFTDSDFESDQDYIDTDTERLWDSDSEVIEFDIDATSSDEETDEESLPQEREAPPPLRRTCSLVQGLCTTGLQPGGMEVRGLHGSGNHCHGEHPDINLHECIGPRIGGQPKDRAESDIQKH